MHVRRAVRVAAQLPTVLIDSSGRALPGLITNVSKNGFGVTTDEPLIAGECVAVRVAPRDEFRAQILWTRDINAGAYFLDSVDLRSSRSHAH